MRTRSAAVLAAAVMTTAGLAAAPASAAPYPGATLIIYSQGAIQNPSNNVVYGHAASLDTPDGSPVPAGATATVAYASCGQAVQTVTYGLDDAAGGPPDGKVAFVHYFSATGAADPMGNSITDKIGPVLDWSATITYPGYDPYVLSGSYSGYHVKRPSCEQILNGGDGDSGGSDPLTVQKWSTKKGAVTVKVGKQVAVTPTRAHRQQGRLHLARRCQGGGPRPRDDGEEVLRG